MNYEPWTIHCIAISCGWLKLVRICLFIEMLTWTICSYIVSYYFACFAFKYCWLYILTSCTCVSLLYIFVHNFIDMNCILYNVLYCYAYILWHEVHSVLYWYVFTNCVDMNYMVYNVLCCYALHIKIDMNYCQLQYKHCRAYCNVPFIDVEFVIIHDAI